MEVNSNVYNTTNLIQVREAKRLMDRIEEDLDNLSRDNDTNTNSPISIIVDIGCGSGNVTQLLGQKFPHKHLLGIDLNSQLVEFALANNTSKTVDFVTSDFSNPWEELDPKIQALEGKADLIFSNMVFHWIKETKITSDNVLRLLKPKGFIYIANGLTNSISDSLPKVEKEELDQILEVDSHEMQWSKWADAFRNAGLQNVQPFLMEGEFTLKSEGEFQMILNLSKQLYLAMIQNPKNLSVNMKNKVERLVFQTYFERSGQLEQDYVFDEGCTLHYSNCHLTAQKP